MLAQRHERAVSVGLEYLDRGECAVGAVDTHLRHRLRDLRVAWREREPPARDRTCEVDREEPLQRWEISGERGTDAFDEGYEGRIGLQVERASPAAAHDREHVAGERQSLGLRLDGALLEPVWGVGG